MKNSKVIYVGLRCAEIHKKNIDELCEHPLQSGFIVPKDAIMDGIE